MTVERPLSGLGVAVTRGEGPDGPLSNLLRKRGAHVLDWGSIRFVPPEDPCPLLGSLARIRNYDWVCFSSPRAVEAVVNRLPMPPKGVLVAAVGPSTASALEEAGWTVELVPRDGRGEGLVEAFRADGRVKGQKVFFPASAVARDVIPDGLTELGAEVDLVTAYQMVRLPIDEPACRAAVEAGRVQVVTFASPSAMEAFREGVGEGLFATLARTTPAAVMGPTTESALKGAGWEKMVAAETPTLPGLADAVARAGTFEEPE